MGFKQRFNDFCDAVVNVLSEQVGFKHMYMVTLQGESGMFYLNKWDLNHNQPRPGNGCILQFYLNKWDLNKLMEVKDEEVDTTFYLNKWDLN